MFSSEAEKSMQRMYVFIIAAALILAVSYSKPIRNFFTPSEKIQEATPPGQEPIGGDDSHEQLGIELYRVAAKLSDLQGKEKLLGMAKENRQWFNGEDYANLDELIKTTKEDLGKAENEYQKARESYAKRTAQKMLEEFSKKQ